MQIKDIEIGLEYAINRHSKLIRFRVTAIITRRVAHAAKATNYVEGWDASARDEIAGGPLTEMFSVPVSDLLGPYDQFTALVAEKERKDAERKARAAAEERARIEVIELLADLVGLPIYAGKDRRQTPGGVETYYAGIKIPDACLPKLVEYLRRRKLAVVA